MITALFLAVAQPAAMPAETTESDCSYEIEEMLKLDRRAFDQDLNGGWRTLANKQGCEAAAAELIREWRHEKRDHAGILYWHEGQMRAYAGQTEEAIALFKRTYVSRERDAGFGWNYYVDGTVAFLERDRERLNRAIEGLKTVPEPEVMSYTRADGTVIERVWSPNLNVLRGFANCWEQTYSDAYGNRACIDATSDE